MADTAVRRLGDNRITFRADPDQASWLAGRARITGGRSPDLQAKQELRIWESVLCAELARLRFTVAELRCLTEVLAGIQPAATPNSVGLAGVASATFHAAIHHSGGLPDYDADLVDELAARLRDLGPAADAALLDGLLRWADGHFEPDRRGFISAGFWVTGS
jgi:hypothetical protein